MFSAAFFFRITSKQNFDSLTKVVDVKFFFFFFLFCFFFLLLFFVINYIDLPQCITITGFLRGHKKCKILFGIRKVLKNGLLIINSRRFMDNSRFPPIYSIQFLARLFCYLETERIS